MLSFEGQIIISFFNETRIHSFYVNAVEIFIMRNVGQVSVLKGPVHSGQYDGRDWQLLPIL